MEKLICAESGWKTHFLPSRKSRSIKIKSGGKIDIRKLIGKLLRPKAGFTPGKYEYMAHIIHLIKS